MTDRMEDIPKPPARPVDGHKGTFGTVVVVGGSAMMVGAPAMTATAAFRSGAGLVKVLTDGGLVPHVIGIEPSATGIERPPHGDILSLGKLLDSLGSGSVMAVGPGMGRSGAQRAVVKAIMKTGMRVVLDADGLNNFADDASLSNPRKPAGSREGELVMTPHPGEFGRLAEAAGLKYRDGVDPAVRVEAACELAGRHRAVVVLKGRESVVADVDGKRYAINQTGNAALATAGSGDVLTGVIAGLMAQGMGGFEAARLGVHVHGLAADAWVADHNGYAAGMLARELSIYIPAALAEVAAG